MLFCPRTTNRKNKSLTTAGGYKGTVELEVVGNSGSIERIAERILQASGITDPRRIRLRTDYIRKEGFKSVWNEIG